jgi:hypothetical protein
MISAVGWIAAGKAAFSASDIGMALLGGGVLNKALTAQGIDRFILEYYRVRVVGRST